MHGTSSVPWDVNCAYKGRVSREGEEDNVSVVRMGKSVKLGGIFETRTGRVGEDGEEEGTGTGVVGRLRLTNAGSANLP